MCRGASSEANHWTAQHTTQGTLQESNKMPQKQTDISKPTKPSKCFIRGLKIFVNVGFKFSIYIVIYSKYAQKENSSSIKSITEI